MESVGLDHRNLRDDAAKLNVVIFEVGAQDGDQGLSGQIFRKVNAIASWLFDLAVMEAEGEKCMILELFYHFEGNHPLNGLSVKENLPFGCFVDTLQRIDRLGWGGSEGLIGLGRRSGVGRPGIGVVV